MIHVNVRLQEIIYSNQIIVFVGTKCDMVAANDLSKLDILSEWRERVGGGGLHGGNSLTDIHGKLCLLL